jgi:hypothetical protein
MFRIQPIPICLFLILNLSRSALNAHTPHALKHSPAAFHLHLHRLPCSRLQPLNRARPKWHQRLLPDDGQGGPPQYLHPAHPWPVLHYQAGGPREQRPEWSCDVCVYEWRHDNHNQRQRYVSLEPRDPFDICSDCLVDPWRVWISKKATFTQGQPIIFSNIVYMGKLDVATFGGGNWPAADDQDGLLKMLDRAHAEGDLPRRSRDRRALYLSHSHLKVGEDRTLLDFSERQVEQTFFHEYTLDGIASVTYVDDNPAHYVLINVSDGATGECHVLTCGTSELAVAIAEACEAAFQCVHVECILNDIDDSISAGIEGRQTKVKSLAEKAAHRNSMKLGEMKPGSPTAGAVGLDPKERASLFEVFDLQANGQPKPGTTVDASSELEALLELLQTHLTAGEHKTFSELVRSYRTEQIEFATLGAGLAELFTPSRIFLLGGCKCFIADPDVPKFQLFVAKHGL